MEYSPKGSSETMEWTAAAKAGGLASGSLDAGEPRSYAVSAWVDVPDRGLVEVSGVPASELDADAARALRKELDLPLRKALVLRRAGDVAAVEDFSVADVWDGWCTLSVRTGDGDDVLVHSAHFSEMNKGSSAPR